MVPILPFYHLIMVECENANYFYILIKRDFGVFFQTLLSAPNRNLCGSRCTAECVCCVRVLPSLNFECIKQIGDAEPKHQKKIHSKNSKKKWVEIKDLEGQQNIYHRYKRPFLLKNQ